MDHELPPNLDDKVEREAYRRELRGVAVGWRVGGLLLLAAAGLVAWKRPDFAGAWIGLLMVAVAMIAIAIVKRSRYHRRRIGGQKV